MIVRRTKKNPCKRISGRMKIHGPRKRRTEMARVTYGSDSTARKMNQFMMTQQERYWRHAQTDLMGMSTTKS